MKFLVTLLFILALGISNSIAADKSTDISKQYFEDSLITLKVKTAFANDKTIQGRYISVRTDHSVVDLTGHVKTKVEFDQATALASRIKLVEAVLNNLTITP